ncbi:lipopolysaccharide heptosyltransferase II [candidate division KSB1 bacterium]|nr:lipopolysaccharide heptosyltransferase II [candidate division KSB1 bacterium]
MNKNFSCILDKKNVKILIIQTAFIGDVVLATPLFSNIKHHNSSAIVHALVTPKTTNILENNPNINKIFVFDKGNRDKGLKGIRSLGRQLRQEKYNVVICPHKSIRSALLAVKTKAPVRIGFKDNSIPFFFNIKSSYNRTKHEVERNLSLLEQFNVKIVFKRPSVFPCQSDKETVQEFLKKQDFNAPYITVAPGSVWATKRWPENSFKSFVRMVTDLKMKVILIGGKQDYSLCEFIKNNNPAILNAAGQFSLLQSAEIIRRSRVLISNDSGPMHLATAVDTPVIAIFGPTVPEFGYYPYGENNIVIEKKLACRPCGRHGGVNCPIGTHECMHLITAKHVFQQTLCFIEPR